MKVLVNLKVASKSEGISSVFELAVSPTDTVLAVKERIATAQMIAFPDQDLLLDGEVLPDVQKCCDCGVKDGSSLDFVVQASEASLVKQLEDLLQARDLSCDELGLLYCYKHGVSVGQALKTVGYEGKLASFMKEQKRFLVESGCVTLLREDTSLQPFCARDEMKKILQASGTNGMDITTVCSKFVQKFNVSLQSMTGMKPAEFFASDADTFLVTGRGSVSLKSNKLWPDQQQQQRQQQQQQRQQNQQKQREQQPQQQKQQLQQQRQQQQQQQQQPKPQQRQEQREHQHQQQQQQQQQEQKNQQQEQEQQEQQQQQVQQTVPQASVQPVQRIALIQDTAEASPPVAADADADNQQYLDLHNRISGRSFNSKVMQTLNGIVDILTSSIFLNIAHIVKGGAVGKGTSIAGAADGEITVFLNGMPAAAQDQWVPPLLKSISGILSDRLSSEAGVDDLRVVGEVLHLRVKGLTAVRVGLAPAFETYTEAIASLGPQTPEARRCHDGVLAKERVQFIAKQPGQVKVTMRLLKWWRDQQTWSSALARPSDELLELVAVYSAVTSKPVDQTAGVANVLSLLACFDELRVVWSNYYAKEEVWAPLLHQRPLLMDPVNPYVNVADPQVFDPQELMALAKSTHFFW